MRDQEKRDPSVADESAPLQSKADSAARAATAQMAAAVVAQRMLAADAQKDVVARSMPALRTAVVPPLAAAVQAAPKATTPAGPGFGSAGFEKLLDDTTDSKARESSSANVLFDGVSSFAERERLITGAQSTICLETFIFADDTTGKKTAALLIAAARRGVQVMVIYDGVGSHGTDAAVFDQMRAAGIQVREYNPPAQKALDINHRSHAKSLVVDGQNAVLGGMNIGDEYAFGGSSQLATHRATGHQQGWRDVDVALAGAAVDDAQAHFFADWAMVGKSASASEQARAGHATPAAASGSAVSVRVIEHRPEEAGDSNTMNAYVAAINASQTTIEIENAYFIPPEPVRKALVAAAKRGVHVRVRTNSMLSSDNGADVEAAHYFYPEMMAAGVEIHEQFGQMLHAKTATFDGTFTLIGSANLNGRSDGRDAEDVVAISDPRTAAEMEKRFNASLVADTDLVTPQQLTSEGRWEHLKQWSVSRAAWTL